MCITRRLPFVFRIRYFCRSIRVRSRWSTPKSGHVRPRQGTEICNFGAPSPLEALHWIFCFFSSIYVQFSKTSPLKSGESSEKSSGENRVKSCHVCGCHGFFRPWPKFERIIEIKLHYLWTDTIIRAPQKGPENWRRAKIVENIFDTFWRFLTFFDVAPSAGPFCGPLKLLHNSFGNASWFGIPPPQTGPRIPISGKPKGPSRTKNTTDSKFTIRSKFATAIVKHYCGQFETTIFKWKLSSKSLQIVKNYGDSKTLRNWVP